MKTPIYILSLLIAIPTLSSGEDGQDSVFRLRVGNLIGKEEQRPLNNLRDPFWPVGYNPNAPEEVVPEPVVEVVEDVIVPEELTEEDKAAIKVMLRSTGTIKKGKNIYAIVNNQMVASGDVVTINFKEKTYKFKVRGIQGGNVQFDVNWKPEEAPESTTD